MGPSTQNRPGSDRAAELVTGTGWLPAMLRRIAARRYRLRPCTESVIARSGNRAGCPSAVNCCPGRTVALGRSENCGLLAALRHRANWRGTPLVAAPRIFVRPSLPPAPQLRATSTRQGFDTAIGMRPISLPDALMIEIQNPSRLPSYAISCARAAPCAAASSFVGNSIPSSSL
jgi:hypothetical protein